MFKVLCLLAVIAVVSAGISQPRPSVHQPRIVKRAAGVVSAEPKETVEAVEGQEDMEKAETFGFGYHAYPSYYHGFYPGYYGYGYPAYYQPSYYHGYYY
uniref:Uncharacterized protein n=1 Tax=Anopheles christyi TaxID=43041 RepID=A0A182KHL3_9DIPT